MVREIIFRRGGWGSQEFDALVAEVALGWRVRWVERTLYRNSKYVDPKPTGRVYPRCKDPNSVGSWFNCPFFSHDVDAAFIIVRDIHPEGDKFKLERDFRTGLYKAEFWGHVGVDRSPAVAICLAVLASKGVHVTVKREWEVAAGVAAV